MKKNAGFYILGVLGVCGVVGGIAVFLYLLDFLMFMSAFVDTDRPPYEKELNQAAETMEAVVLALEEYHAANGQYPDKLENLVPSYLDGIPELPENFYDFLGVKGIEDCQLSGQGMQDYELNATLNAGALNSDMTLYYVKDKDLQPTDFWRWNRHYKGQMNTGYKHKVFFRDHWVYCY